MAPTSKLLNPCWDHFVLKVLVTLVLFTLWLKLLRSLPISNFLSLLLAALRFCNSQEFALSGSRLSDSPLNSLLLSIRAPHHGDLLSLDLSVLSRSGYGGHGQVLQLSHLVRGPFLFSGPVTSQFLSECVFFPGSATICPPYGMNQTVALDDHPSPKSPKIEWVQREMNIGLALASLWLGQLYKKFAGVQLN